MGAKISREDFEWSYTEEPHATRRKEMLEKYPEMKKLMGSDPKFKYICSALVIVQLIICVAIRNLPWPSILIMAYVIGGTINHSLSLAIHEISHNLAFGHSRPNMNRFFGFFVNLPIGFPATVPFKKYHLDHHRYQGDVKLDVDIPSAFETSFFTRTITKLLWVILQPFFYAIRPFFVNPKPLAPFELSNIILIVSFDLTVLYYFGAKSLVYLMLGTILGTGLHPLAGHFISEHYMFVKGYETYSYYGPLNWLTWNVGYHNEHHDFPSIPGSRLPEVRKIAPEYYENLPYHTSWVKVIWDFIFDPEIGPYSRVKRSGARENGNDDAPSSFKHDSKSNGLTDATVPENPAAKIVRNGNDGIKQRVVTNGNHAQN